VRSVLLAELVGTALLCLVGLSLVVLVFGEGSPVIGVLPSEGWRRLITGFLGQVLAKAGPSWLAGLITRREPPEAFMRALERQPNDIKVIVQFAEV
jgi:hypothetical protein